LAIDAEDIARRAPLRVSVIRNGFASAGDGTGMLIQDGRRAQDA
jgi:hypothetical protein